VYVIMEYILTVNRVNTSKFDLRLRNGIFIIKKKLTLYELFLITRFYFNTCIVSFNNCGYFRVLE